MERSHRDVEDLRDSAAALTQLVRALERKHFGKGKQAPGCPALTTATRWNDTNANFTFPAQDVITRQRLSGGFKLKLSVVFLAAQFEANRPRLQSVAYRMLGS